MSEVTHEQMKTAANELNDILGLDPPIQVSSDAETLRVELSEAAGELLPDDELTKDVSNILKRMELLEGEPTDKEEGEGDEQEEEEAPDQGESGEQAQADDGEEEGAQEDGEEEDEKEEEGEQASESDEGPAVMNQDPPNPKYKKADALYDALKVGGTREEIVQMIEQRYRHHRGGKYDYDAARTQCNVHLPVLKRFGAVVEDDGVWKIPEDD